jgi:membrane protein required for colicin V production
MGFLFGAARGLVLVVIAVLFLNFFIAPDRQPVWIAASKTKPWLDTLGADLMNRLPDDPEAEILERIRGEQAGQSPAPPTGEQVVRDPAAPGEDAEAPVEEDAPADGPADEAPADESAGDDPGIADDDQNQLERQIEAPAGQ